MHKTKITLWYISLWAVVLMACLVCFRLKCAVRVLFNADWVRFCHIEARHEIQPRRYLCQQFVVDIIQPSAGLGALDVNLVESGRLAAPIFCCGPAELLHKPKTVCNVNIRL